MPGTFLIVCMKLQQHKSLKLMKMIFFGGGGNLTGVLGQKGTQITFLSFIQNDSLNYSELI